VSCSSRRISASSASGSRHSAAFWSLFCRATPDPGEFAVVRDRALTFHVGDSRDWKHERYLDYFRHNQRAALAVLDRAQPLSSEAAVIRSAIASQTSP
jgi:hypothetical protein